MEDMQKECGKFCGNCGLLEKVFESLLTFSNKRCIILLEHLFEMSSGEKVRFLGTAA